MPGRGGAAAAAAREWSPQVKEGQSRLWAEGTAGKLQRPREAAWSIGGMETSGHSGCSAKSQGRSG